MNIKVCGMKYLDNMQEVADLQPNYLGFIFYEKSKRNFEGVIPKFPMSIKKVGVFVNEHLDIVVSLLKEYQLDAVQLHGDESIVYIKELRKHLPKIEIIKVFGIQDDFDFDILEPYLDEVDYFLFDTKGKERGGNGVQFDWAILEKYPYVKPYFLSGGIGLQDTSQIVSFLEKKESKYCYALDINSRFESEPGVKKIEELKKFKKELASFKN